jgi:hypothetical protein
MFAMVIFIKGIGESLWRINPNPDKYWKDDGISRMS